MNSNGLVIPLRQKQTNKQTNKYLYMKTEFQNSIARLSLCHIMDIKIAWLNPCWENKISIKVTLKPSVKKLKNTLIPQGMNFKNLLVYALNDDIMK